ncbi:MAG: FkbM family methyltransferase [Sulfurisoma sp.]|nr:FkbM family methyltransferase [Sulfurisoma sp.]
MSIDLAVDGQPTDAVLAKAQENGITIFGAGTFARTLARALQPAGIRVAAMVVTAPHSDNCDGIPLVALASLDERLRQLPMWIGVFNREAHSDFAALVAVTAKAGVRTSLAPPQYFEIVAKAMGWRYWLTDRGNYAHHHQAIEAAIDSMADNRSRQQLSATIAFRLGADPDAVPQPDTGPQYFPSFMTDGMDGTGTLVDGGAYDGDTLRQAASHLKLANAVAFEPDPENFARLADTARTLSFPVTCFPCGLSSETRHLRYSVGQGEASAICGEGEGLVQVARLDDCLPATSIDYLKLDVEGHEMEALAGAAQCLRRDRPRLAVAGYHRWDDVWRIPRFIQQLDLDYRIAFRIHAHNTFDGVFYAY